MGDIPPAGGPASQGAGGWLEKRIDTIFHWNSRIEWFVVGGVIVAAALRALDLKKRLYGRLSVSDVGIAIVFFTPAHADVTCRARVWIDPTRPLASLFFRPVDIRGEAPVS